MDRTLRTEDRAETCLVKILPHCSWNWLLIEDECSTALLKQSRQLGWREIELRRPDPHIVASTARAVDIEPAADLDHQHEPVRTVGPREQFLTDDRADRRITVVSHHVHYPLLDVSYTRFQEPAYDTRVIHPEEDRTSVGVREGHALTSEVLGIRGDY